MSEISGYFSTLHGTCSMAEFRDIYMSEYGDYDKEAFVSSCNNTNVVVANVLSRDRSTISFLKKCGFRKVLSYYGNDGGRVITMMRPGTWAKARFFPKEKDE